MADEKIRYAYRICPCFPYDIEGIQTWLEDMAAQGLVLEADGTFLGLFTFQKTVPQKLQYRLSPVKEKKGFFSDSGDCPNEEEQEYSKLCGWEYLVRYGSFYIYRATEPNALPLHTDPAIHALALESVKKQQRSTVVGTILNFLTYSFLTHRLFSFFKSGALIGVIFLLNMLAFGIWLVVSNAVAIARLSKYQKRLRNGDALDKTKDWRSLRFPVRCLKLFPLLAALVFLLTWGTSLEKSYHTVSLTDYPEEPPFAVLENIFPQGEFTHSTNFGDYDTVLRYHTALSENWEWNDEASLTDGTESYHCILRIQYHDTFSSWWAKGLFRDYYLYERFRYRGKRFEVLDAPSTGFDDVKVYTSYGILHVLILQDNTVTHAVVNISQQNQRNHWQLWLAAMEEKMLNNHMP